MSEVMRERLKKSVGQRVTVFLKNNFRYEGKITNCDDIYLELLENNGYKIILITDISDVDIPIKTSGGEVK